MRRLLYCLPLLLPLGCALAPEGTSTALSPIDEPTFSAEPDKPIPPSKQDKTKRRPTTAEMEKLAQSDLIAFLKECMARYDREVRGYRVLLAKRERVDGKLMPPEEVRCAFRQKPFSVLMVWEKGAGRASKTLFVKGENDDKLLALPSGRIARFVAGVVSRDVDGPDARATSRFPVTKFGIRTGIKGALDAWVKARKRGDLKIQFNGTKRLEELDNRPCWEVKRIGYRKPEDDGILEATFYFDKENWLQTGSILRGKDGKLIASYFFRDLELNPKFPADTFTREALKR
jgi:hypothetical protein